MRAVSHSYTAGQGLAGFFNSSKANQDNLISILNKKQNPIFTPMSYTPATASNVISDKGTYDPKTGTWASSGNQSVALQCLEDRQGFNQIINKALAEKGITLSVKEKITLTMDKDGRITVSGIKDAQKRTKIEEALNNALKDKSSQLLMHIESIKVMNGKQNPKVLDKWMVYDFLKDQTGQNLSDLKLVNGKIVGANEKLQKIINGEQDLGEDNEYAQEVITKLKSVLAYGIDKIPDLKQSIDFQKNSLIDQNVKNGFGTEQLKTWFNDFILGRATLDAKA